MLFLLHFTPSSKELQSLCRFCLLYLLCWCGQKSPNSLRLRSLSMARRGRTTGMGRSSGGHMSEEWGTITDSDWTDDDAASQTRSLHT